MKVLTDPRLKAIADQKEIPEERAIAFRSLINEAVVRKKLQQSELAKLSGVSQATISASIINGPAKGMRFIETCQVGQALGISPNRMAEALGLYEPTELEKRVRELDQKKRDQLAIIVADMLGEPEY